MSFYSACLRVACIGTLWIGSQSVATVAEEWPQWRGPRRDGVWQESGLIQSFVGAEIPRRWTAAIGAGYSGPTVADGRVLVMDRIAEPEETERIHCFDAQTGDRLWSHAYPCSYDGISYTAGPRASVTIDDDRCYAIGATGHLHCLGTANGQVHWQRDLRQDFQIRMPTWGISGSPLIEGDLVILQIGGSGDACIVALDKRTGQTRWQALDLNQAFVERSARWFLNLESAHEQTTRKPGRELAAVVIGIGQRLSGVGRGGGTEASRLRLRGCFT